MTVPLRSDPSDVRMAMRRYRKASDAHMAACSALIRAEHPDAVVRRYRAVIVTGEAVRDAVHGTLGMLGLPIPEEDATLDDLNGLVPDIITIQEVVE